MEYQTIPNLAGLIEDIEMLARPKCFATPLRAAFAAGMILCCALWSARAADPVLLGPPNGGAEDGMTGWLYGTLGSGSVSIDTVEPATGRAYFKIGIADVTSAQTNRADLRSKLFPIGNAAQTLAPIKFSFAYKLPGKVKAGDNVEVYLRFFGKSDQDFLAQDITKVGAASLDSEMANYKTLVVSNIYAPKGASSADVWVVANVFTPWSSGFANFDDFSVTTVPKMMWGRLLVEVALIIAACVIGFIFGTMYCRSRHKT